MILLPPTLTRYLAKSYAVNMAGMAVILLGIIYLFDTVELLRRASKHDDVDFGTVVVMGLLKIPEMAGVIAPFILLFSALFTFWQLAKRQELVVLRSSGVSVLVSSMASSRKRSASRSAPSGTVAPAVRARSSASTA